MRFRFQRFDAFCFVLSSFRFVFVFRSPHLDSIITCVVVWASCIQIYLVDPVDCSGSAYFAQETDIWHAFRCVPFVIWFIECRKWDMLVHHRQQQLQRSQPQNAAEQETNTNIFVDEIFTCALYAWLRRIRRLSRQEINWSLSPSLSRRLHLRLCLSMVNPNHSNQTTYFYLSFGQEIDETCSTLASHCHMIIAAQQMSIHRYR